MLHIVLVIFHHLDSVLIELFITVNSLKYKYFALNRKSKCTIVSAPRSYGYILYLLEQESLGDAASKKPLLLDFQTFSSFNNPRIFLSAISN